MALDYKVFAMKGGKKCYTSATAHQTYKKHGSSDKCLDDGRGETNALDVYEILAGKLLYTVPLYEN